ncbi:2'-5' RNA ligase [Sphingobium scionense]
MLARTAPLYRLIVALKPPTRVTRQIDHFAETLAPDADRILPAHQHITLGITDDWPDYPYGLVKAMHRSFTGILADPFDLSLDQLSEGGRSVRAAAGSCTAAASGIAAQGGLGDEAGRGGRPSGVELQPAPDALLSRWHSGDPADQRLPLAGGGFRPAMQPCRAHPS